MENDYKEAVSGVEVEEKKFTWRIKSFSVVKEHGEFIKDQKFEFEAGGSIGLSSRWRVFLKRDKEKYPRCIGVYLQCLTAKPETEPNYLIAECCYTIQKSDGTMFLDKKIGTRDWWAQTSGWGFGSFIEKTGEIPLVEGSLVIHCKFQLYANASPLKKLSIENLLEEFNSSFKAKASGDLARLIKLPVSCSGGIEICSSDGKQFQARKEVLAVRSPVFEAMFESGMKESAEGKLELADISSQTLEVLLHYFCNGELLPVWRQTDVILELTNAAAKYQLQDLLRFLDTALGKVCDDGNVLPLLNLVDKLDLKNAKESLMKFVGRKGFNSKEEEEVVTKTQVKKRRCCIV